MESFANHRADDYLGRAKCCVSLAIANDLKHLAECYSNEVEVLHPSSMTRNRGIFQILAQVSRFHAAFSDVRIEHCYSEAHYHKSVSLWYRIGASHTGTFALGNTNILPSGEPVSFSYCVVMRFTDEGKICEVFGLYNRLEIYRQLNISLLDTVVPSMLKNASHTVRDMPVASHSVGSAPKPAGQSFTSLYDPPKQMFSDTDKGDVLYSLENVKRFLRHCVEDEWDSAAELWVPDNSRTCYVQNPFTSGENMHTTRIPQSPSGPLRQIYDQLFTSFHDCSITPSSIVCGQETRQEYEGSNFVAIHGEFRAIPPSEFVPPESSGENRIPIFPQPFHVRASIALYFQTDRDTGLLHAMWVTLDVPSIVAQAMTPPALSLVRRSPSIMSTYSTVQLLRLCISGCANAEVLSRYCLESVSLHTPPSSVMFNEGMEHHMSYRMNDTIEEEHRDRTNEGAPFFMDPKFDVRTLDGIPKVAATWQYWHQRFSRIRIRIRRIVATQEAVAVNMVLTGKHTGSISGIDPTYQNVSIQAMSFFQLDQAADSVKDIHPTDTRTVHQFMPRVNVIHTWMDLPALYSQMASPMNISAEKLMNGVLRHHIGEYYNDYGGAQAIRSVENLLNVYTEDGPNIFKEYADLHERMNVLATPNIIMRSPTVPVNAESDDAFIHNATRYMKNSTSYIGLHDVATKLYAMKAPFEKVKLTPVLTVAQGPFVSSWLTIYGQARDSEREIARLRELEGVNLETEKLDEHLGSAVTWHGHQLVPGRRFFINAPAMFSVAQQGAHVSNITMYADRVSKSIQLGVEDPRFYQPGTEKAIVTILERDGVKNVVPCNVNVEAALLQHEMGVGID